MFQGVQATQKTLMIMVARKMLMYFGYNPLTSLLKGYVPIHISCQHDGQYSSLSIREVEHTCSNLVADGCKHEAESNKELCGS